MSETNRTNSRAPNNRHWGSGEDKPDVMDCTPVVMPAGFDRPESLEEKFAKYFHQQTAIMADENEKPESWEEANDFTDEDPDTLDLSPYQFDDLAPPTHAVGADHIEGDPEAFKPEINPQGTARSLTDAENRQPDSPEPAEAGDSS